MTNDTDATTPTLRRFLPAARALREDVKRSVHMDLPLSGDLAMNTLKALIARATQATDDPYLLSLADALTAGTYASDKEKISAVLFVAGQLVAYIESEVAAREGGCAGESIDSDIASLTQRISAEVRRTVGDALAGLGR